MTLLPRDTYEKLEFDKVIQLVESGCTGEIGRALARNLEPSTKFRQINRWLDEVAEFRQGSDERSLFTIGAYDDVEEELRMLRVEGLRTKRSGPGPPERTAATG